MTPTQLEPTFQYVELLARSNFSFLQAASHPEEMVSRSRELGYQGLAICDLNGLYGVVRGYQAATRPSLFTTEGLAASQLNSQFQFFSGAEMQLFEGGSVALLPMNKDGYTNLCKLITASKRQTSKGYSSLNMIHLRENSDDLLCLALPPWQESQVYQLAQIFEDRLYLPVWKDLTWESLQYYDQALALEQKGFSLVATQRPWMHDKSRKPLMDILSCTLHRTHLDQIQTRVLQNSERHLKPLSELRSLWLDRPDLLAKTVSVARRINFSLNELRYQYPKAVLPQGLNSSEFLRQLTEKGLKLRYPEGVTTKVRKLVEYELALIKELDYEDYFLTLWDICNFAKQQGILHQGRGSAANSVVCYCLGLTAVDPDKFDLLFERFISKERGEPPDIDIDFESQRREEVLQYIYKKYGDEHAAMVSTVICYRSRMAIRDVAKALRLDQNQIDKMVKFMGREGLSRLIENPSKAQEWKLDPKRFKILLNLTQELIGFPRHLGIHTGGFLISQRPILESVPVEKARMQDRYVVQWNKDDLNFLKMMKIDILGLGMLTALRRSFELLKASKGEDLDLYSIPHDHQPTYDMIQKADTVGVFQIESRAQMSLLPRLKPKSFYDLVIEVAIVRPGPLQGGMVHPFLRRRDGIEEVSYAHPDLEPILRRTFGVPIFQEQIMQIAHTVCGFTPGEADELRRIMSSSWKKHDLMEGLRQRLINGMLNYGIQKNFAEQIYQTIVGFASYGFPESHAASFAHITYASCYIKQQHPEVFLCALLNSQPMGFYSPRSLIADAQRHGVKVLPLDIQQSVYDYSLEKEASRLNVRTGFRALRGLKEKHIQSLLEEREKNGPFHNLSDLVRRTQLQKQSLLLLASSGALSVWGQSPREVLWEVLSIERDPESLLFGQAHAGGSENIPTESDWESLGREYETQGYSLTEHPLGLLRAGLNQWKQKQSFSRQFLTAQQLKDASDKQNVVIAGMMSLMQKPSTAKGFVFLTMEDETGLFNVILKPDVYQKYRLLLINHPLLMLKGELQKVSGVINLKAEHLAALPVKSFLKPISPAQFNRSF